MSNTIYMQEYRSRKKSGTFVDRRRKNHIFKDYCLNCNKLLPKRFRSNRPRKYCNNDHCQHEYQRTIAMENNIANIGSVKKYLIEKNGRCCEQCSRTMWNSKPIPLDLHHIDGNRNNNTIENVQLLCLNCHGQTSNFKIRNKGNRQSKQFKPFYLSKLDQ